MGFFDKAFQIAKDVGTTVVTRVNEEANKIRETKEKYQSLGDDELINIAKSDGFFGKTSQEKSIAFSILKSRGYTAEDLRSR